MILYEHPFNERIRTYLRLEHLYARLSELVARETVIDHHYALQTIFEIMDVAGKAELKIEVLKDIDKQKNALMTFRGNPAIDEDALNHVILELDKSFASLSQIAGRVGSSLGENDWLMAIRSRASMPGGSCSFDLPSYYAWQHISSEERRIDIQPWMDTLAPMSEAITLLLRLIRDSGTTQKMIAINGTFQYYVPQGKPYQLAHIYVDERWLVIPEISVNRLMITARFTHHSVLERARQTQNDIAFELTLCT